MNKQSRQPVLVLHAARSCSVPALLIVPNMHGADSRILICCNPFVMDGNTDATNCRSREKSGALAFALVLRSNEEDVWAGSHAGKDPDACAWSGVGQHRHGGRTEQKAACLLALYAVEQSASRITDWLSVLSGHQLCRGQKSRTQRRQAGGHTW